MKILAKSVHILLYTVSSINICIVDLGGWVLVLGTKFIEGSKPIIDCNVDLYDRL